MDLEREESVLLTAIESFTCLASEKSRSPEPFELTHHDERGNEGTEELTIWLRPPPSLEDAP